MANGIIPAPVNTIVVPITFAEGAADQGLAGGGAAMSRFSVYGNVCCLTLSVLFSKEVTTPGWYNICSIPQIYAPKVGVYTPWFRFDNTFYGELLINTGGGIYIGNTESFNNAVLRANLVWII